MNLQSASTISSLGLNNCEIFNSSVKNIKESARCIKLNFTKFLHRAKIPSF